MKSLLSHNWTSASISFIHSSFEIPSGQILTDAVWNFSNCEVNIGSFKRGFNNLKRFSQHFMTLELHCREQGSIVFWDIFSSLRKNNFFLRKLPRAGTKGVCQCLMWDLLDALCTYPFCLKKCKIHEIQRWRSQGIEVVDNFALEGWSGRLGGDPQDFVTAHRDLVVVVRAWNWQTLEQAVITQLTNGFNSLRLPESLPSSR